MADFTALHRLTGSQPGDLTDRMLDRAVALRVQEASDLDWKRSLPEAKGLAGTDIVKDIAAMANSGGGLLVFGVTETGGTAEGRRDVGEVTETYLRALVGVAVSAISPPVFGVRPVVLGDETRAVVLEVPAGVDGPHLVYRGEVFGAPVRNGPDTVWMREAQLAVAYRVRFEAQREARKALTEMYDEAELVGDPKGQAWMFGVARPVQARRPPSRPTREMAVSGINRAIALNESWLAGSATQHVFVGLEADSPRPGLRRWSWRTPQHLADRAPWRRVAISIHDDGSISVGAAVGGHRLGQYGQLEENAPPWLIMIERCEAVVAGLMALLRDAEQEGGSNLDFDVEVGIEWSGDDHPLVVDTTDGITPFRYQEDSTPMRRFVPVRATVRQEVDGNTFLEQAIDVALDIANQAGLTRLQVLRSRTS